MKKYLVVLTISTTSGCGSDDPIVCNSFAEASDYLENAYNEQIAEFKGYGFNVGHEMNVNEFNVWNESTPCVCTNGKIHEIEI